MPSLCSCYSWNPHFTNHKIVVILELFGRISQHKIPFCWMRSYLRALAIIIFFFFVELNFRSVLAWNSKLVIWILNRVSTASCNRICFFTTASWSVSRPTQTLYWNRHWGRGGGLSSKRDGSLKLALYLHAVPKYKMYRDVQLSISLGHSKLESKTRNDICVWWK